jgi:hypothetical protein
MDCVRIVCESTILSIIQNRIPKLAVPVMREIASRQQSQRRYQAYQVDDRAFDPLHLS